MLKYYLRSSIYLIAVYILLSSKFAFASKITQVPAYDAPDLALQIYDGSRNYLSQLEGRVVVLYFWATWCGHCVANIPKLAKLQSQFNPKELIVVPVSIESGRLDHVKQFFKLRSDLQNLGVYIDADDVAASRFGATSIPRAFIINKQGQVVAKVRGTMNWDSEEAVSMLKKLNGS